MLPAFFTPQPVRSEQLSVSPTSFQLRQNLSFLQQLLCLNLAQAFHHFFSGSDTRGWWWLKWTPPTKFWLVLFYFFIFFCNYRDSTSERNIRLIWITDKAKLWVGLAPGFFSFSFTYMHETSFSILALCISSLIFQVENFKFWWQWQLSFRSMLCTTRASR